MFKQISQLLTSIGNQPDELIANRYQVKYLIGKGAMGEVYCAEDQKFDGVKVAIKFLSESILNKKMQAKFEREAQLNALLGEQTIHIVKVKDYGLNNNNVPFYVMEFLEGNDLDKIINSKVLSLRKFLSFTRQICLAVQCAHHGIMVDGVLSPIIHRDIKPANIFIVQDFKGGELVKVLDFGIARIINPYKSQTLNFMGTPQYCSPEQMAEQELDARSDIYSLGVMMYKILTGKMPIEAKYNNFQAWYDAHHKLKPKPLPRSLNLPSSLDRMIMSCLEKSPDNRPQTAEEILKVINSVEREHDPIKTIIHTPPPSDGKNKNLLPLEEIYRHSSWPADKPQQKIVFPVVIESKQGVFASLWSMLEPEDILKFNPSSIVCYNHFLCQASPHPMLLWISLLYSRKHGPKWLPCYLDLKTELGEQIADSLVKHNLYHILLFALNKPEKYQQVIKIQVPQPKAKEIKMFLEKSNYRRDKKQPEASKKILKEQFEQMKVKILEVIERVNSK
jgi:serine/threonine-protein kinase